MNYSDRKAALQSAIDIAIKETCTPQTLREILIDAGGNAAKAQRILIEEVTRALKAPKSSNAELKANLIREGVSKALSETEATKRAKA